MHNNFPLSPFLTSLERDGIYTTIRDYDRISTVLRCRNSWTMAQLRQILMSLIVSSPEQAEIFRRRFDQFFDMDSGIGTEFTPQEIENILEELRTIFDTTPEQSPEKPEEQPRLMRERDKKKEETPKFNFKILIPIALSVIAIVAIVLFWWTQREPEPTPKISVTPPSVNLTFPNPDSTYTTELNIKNSGNAPLEIENISLMDTLQPCFSASCTTKILLPDSSCPVHIAFSPDSIGEFNNRLLVGNNATEKPVSIPLSATIIKPDTEIVEKSEEPERLYKNIPYISKIENIPPEKKNQWIKTAIIAGIFLLLVLFYALYLRWTQKPPNDKAPEFDPDKPRYFRMSKIGGEPSPFLDKETLDILGDSLGYFQSEDISRFMDPDGSVSATVENGGIPTFVYHKLKRIRSIIILEDAHSQALEWNTTPKELANGLSLRGISVMYGKFFGSPEKFQKEDGTMVHLEDIEDQRGGYLMLIFSDGKGLDTEKPFVLESLSHWPQIAWIDPRDKKFWDESTQFISDNKLPVYPATKNGLIQAMERFLSERNPQSDFSEDMENWQGVPPLTTQNLDAYVENLLGDALLWAQACAMMQPVSLGLADKIRQKFYSSLPPERIERLFLLPNTTHTISGLYFSSDILSVLRKGLLVHQKEDTNQLIHFILKKLENVTPANIDENEISLSYLTWFALHETLRMDLGSDEAIENLLQLLRSNVAIRNYVFAMLKKILGCEVSVLNTPENEANLKKLQEFVCPPPKNAMITITTFTENTPVSADITLTKDDEKISTIDNKKTELPPGNWKIHATAKNCVPTTANVKLTAGETKTFTINLLTIKQKIAHDILDSIKFVEVEGGEYQMGDTFGDGYEREKPVHTVRLDSFNMGKYQVTNEQYAKFLNEYGSDTVKEGEYKGQEMIEEYKWGVKKENGQWKPQEGYENHPVVYITWYGANEFCKWLSEKTDTEVRLPTEAEWEYAARGGKESNSYKYSGSDDPDEVAWFRENSYNKGSDHPDYGTHSVNDKKKKPNELGIYHMSGNVYEWCSDWYYGKYYQYCKDNNISKNPDNAKNMGSRVLRGGSWYFNEFLIPVTNRNSNYPDYRYYNVGFRISRVISK